MHQKQQKQIGSDATTGAQDISVGDRIRLRTDVQRDDPFSTWDEGNIRAAATVLLIDSYRQL